MAYIGKSPSVGAYKVCDAITTSATDTFNLLVGGVATSPETANNCIVSLNGVVQKPGASGGFTISGSTIVFASALTTADVIDFIYILGDVMSIGTPSDSTVSLAKLTATGSASSSTFLRGDNAWASAGGGKLGQVVQTIKTDTEAANPTSFTDCSGMTVAITPSATSSKVLVCVNAMMSVTGETGAWQVAVGGSALTNPTIIGDAAGSRFQALGPNLYTGVSSIREKTCTCMILHSPSSTSEETYKIQWYVKTSGYNCQLNHGAADTDSADFGRFSSTITVMEILA